MLYKKVFLISVMSCVSHQYQFTHQNSFQLLLINLYERLLVMHLRETFYQHCLVLRYELEVLNLIDKNLKFLMKFRKKYFTNTRTLAMLLLIAFCCWVRYAPLHDTCKCHLKGYMLDLYIYKVFPAESPKKNFLEWV